MADISTTGTFIGTGKPESVRIEVLATDNQEVVDTPSVVLSIAPTDLTSGAERRVETYLSAADAALLAEMLLDFSRTAEQAISEGEDVSGDYSG